MAEDKSDPKEDEEAVGGGEHPNYEFNPETYVLKDKQRGDEEIPPEAQIWKGLEAGYDRRRLAQNIWRFMVNYDAYWHKDNITAEWDAAHMVKLLEEGKQVLETEKYVVDLSKQAGPWVIAPPMYAHVDSLTNQLSMVGTPPHRRIVFMGCYFGTGSAHVEQFLFILAMKLLFPKHVVMLRGHTDDEEQMHKLDLAHWLLERCIPQTDGTLDKVLELLRDCVGALPVAALLPNRLLIMNGGPGPKMRKCSLEKLASIPKGRLLRRPQARLIQEACWTSLVEPGGSARSDGTPQMTARELSDWMGHNNIEFMIRGRQQVDDGMLMYPDDVLTMSGVTNYGDILSNPGTWLHVDGYKMFAHRWYHAEMSFESLFACKYANGRNSIARRFNWQD